MKFSLAPFDETLIRLHEIALAEARRELSFAPEAAIAKAAHLILRASLLRSMTLQIQLRSREVPKAPARKKP